MKKLKKCFIGITKCSLMKGANLTERKHKHVTIIVGIMLLCLTFFPFSLSAQTFATHYIFGTAEFSDGHVANGARVTITSNHGTLVTWVNSSGHWQVNCGSSGQNWPEGTNFSVKIVGCCGHKGWTGLATGVVEGSESDMGHIILYPNQAPNTPVITFHQYYVKINETATFSILSLDPNKHDISYRLNWDANGSDELSAFSNLHPYGEPYVCNHTWSEPGTYAISAVN
ncbi:MAG: hypothetical protein R6U58_04710 [Bacteroidales bacterium]